MDTLYQTHINTYTLARRYFLDAKSGSRFTHPPSSTHRSTHQTSSPHTHTGHTASRTHWSSETSGTHGYTGYPTQIH